MKIFLLILAVLLISESQPYVYAQSRLLNTRSYSDLLRSTNPREIKSVGKIEGREVTNVRNSISNYNSQNSAEERAGQSLKLKELPEFDFNSAKIKASQNIKEF